MKKLFKSITISYNDKRMDEGKRQSMINKINIDLSSLSPFRHFFQFFHPFFHTSLHIAIYILNH